MQSPAENHIAPDWAEAVTQAQATFAEVRASHEGFWRRMQQSKANIGHPRTPVSDTEEHTESDGALSR